MSLIAAGANELHPLPPLSPGGPDSIRSIRTTYAQTDGWTGLCRVSRTRARAVLVRPVRRARDPLRKFSVSFC